MIEDDSCYNLHHFLSRMRTTSTTSVYHFLCRFSFEPYEGLNTNGHKNVKQPSKEAHHLLGNVIDSDDEQVQALSWSSRIAEAIALGRGRQHSPSQIVEILCQRIWDPSIHNCTTITSYLYYSRDCRHAAATQFSQRKS